MDVSILRDLIKLEFDAKSMPLNAEINEAINETIRDINRNELINRCFITISGNDENVWRNITANWGDVTENWGNLESLKYGFSWDSDTKCLTIPDSIIKIDDIYREDIKQIPMSYTALYNNYEGTEDYVYERYGTYGYSVAKGYSC